VDGELARARFEQSPSGARLDLMGDYLTHLAAFLGLGIGLARQGSPRLAAWAAVVLFAGVGVAMTLMHIRFVRPTLARFGDIHKGGKAETDGAGPRTVVVERLAGRDYTYLLVGCALVGHLEWFLYAAAVGSWVFVVGLLWDWWRLAAVGPARAPLGRPRARAVAAVPERAPPALRRD